MQNYKNFYNFPKKVKKDFAVYIFFVNFAAVIFNYIFKGILVGLTASITLGPVAILCIQRTLNKGRLSGFISGVGAAFADTFYALIAGFGVSMLISYIDTYQLYIRAIGSSVLILMGILLIRNNVGRKLRENYKKSLLQKENTQKKYGKGLISDFFSVFGLTLSNPITIFIFSAFFTAFDIIEMESKSFSVFLILLGILSGALLWWFVLSIVINLLKSRFRIRQLLIINRIAGILIILFGI